MEKVEITFDIFNKIQEIYKIYDSGETEDKYAVRNIISYVKNHEVLFREFNDIREKWSEIPTNDALLEIMDFVENKTEIPGYHYETTDDYDLVVVKNY